VQDGANLEPPQRNGVGFMKRQWRPGLIWLVVVSLMGAAWWLAPEVAAAREAVVSCVFTGTAPGGNLFVAGDPEDISSAHRVSLYGVRIPPQAQPAFNKYVQRMLGGAQLCVRIKQRITGQSIPGLVGEVMIAQGIAYASLNKAVLRDGYGQLTADAPAAYRPFAAYAKRRRSGLYSVGRPRWPRCPRRPRRWARSAPNSTRATRRTASR